MGDYSYEENDSVRHGICYMCGSNQNTFIPSIGIALSMAGWEYAFCEECAKKYSIYDLFKKMFINMGYTWPPV